MIFDEAEHAMVYIGMEVHQQSTTFCFFDPAAEEGLRCRAATRLTTVEGIRAALQPHDGRCLVAFEVGTQAQWVLTIAYAMMRDDLPFDEARIAWMAVV